MVDRKVIEYKEDRGISHGHLFGFGINSEVLDRQHKDWLREMVIPLLAGRGSVSIIGHASRSGKRQT